MKIIGIISTVILVALILTASHLYVGYIYFGMGQSVAVENVLAHTFEVCQQGGALLVAPDGTEYFCQRGTGL